MIARERDGEGGYGAGTQAVLHSVTVSQPKNEALDCAAQFHRQFLYRKCSCSLLALWWRVESMGFPTTDLLCGGVGELSAKWGGDFAGWNEEVGGLWRGEGLTWQAGNRWRGGGSVGPRSPKARDRGHPYQGQEELPRPWPTAHPLIAKNAMNGAQLQGSVVTLPGG
jgi:hypothetical protein